MTKQKTELCKTCGFTEEEHIKENNIEKAFGKRVLKLNCPCKKFSPQKKQEEKLENE